MTANTTDNLTALRKQIADVEQRHRQRGADYEYEWWLCEDCMQDWPCETANLARQMTRLLDGLEGIQDESPLANGHSLTARDLQYMARNAIASACPHPEGARTQEQENDRGETR